MQGLTACVCPALTSGEDVQLMDEESERLRLAVTGTANYESVARSAEAAEPCQIADIADSMDHHWNCSCHRRLSSFFRSCFSGVRSCLSEAMVLKNPVNPDYVISPANIICSGISGFFGYKAGELIYESDYHNTEYSEIKHTEAVLLGTVAGVMVGFFILGPLLYQFRLGSWFGFCRDDGQSPCSDC